jgi:hypothetical protein
MFFNEEQKMKENAKSEAMDEVINLIAQGLLESKSVPENDKMSIRVILAAQSTCKTIHNIIVEKYAKPGNEANTETLKEVAEYLALVEKGIVQFVESTPFVSKEVNKL